MRFGEVQKDDLLLLTGELRGIKSQAIAIVTLVEPHGNDLYITYKCEFGDLKHSNTICVHKEADKAYVFIPNRVWRNIRYKLYLRKLELGYLRKDTPWNCKSTRRYDVCGGKNKYLYTITIINNNGI